MAGNAGKYAAGGALAGSLVPGVGTVTGGLVGAGLGTVADILGGNASADAQKAAQRRARGDLTQGYANATGYQKPIYDTGIGAYTDLAGGFKGGEFNTLANWDPNQIFNDPEYKATLASGRAALNNDANAQGSLFSTASDRDLTRFGQDLFASRGDELYGRAERANNTRFNQGMSLANPGLQAAGTLSNLAVNEGQDLANNSLGSGAIRAGNIQKTTGAITNLLGDVTGGNQYQEYLKGLGKGKKV
jgi:hypothetical protein